MFRQFFALLLVSSMSFVVGCGATDAPDEDPGEQLPPAMPESQIDDSPEATAEPAAVVEPTAAPAPAPAAPSEGAAAAPPAAPAAVPSATAIPAPVH